MGGVGGAYALTAATTRGTMMKTTTFTEGSESASTSPTTTTSTKLVIKGNGEDINHPYSITYEGSDEGIENSYSRLKIHHSVPKSANDDPGKYILLDETSGKKLAICLRNKTDLTSYQVLSVSPPYDNTKAHVTIKSTGEKLYEWMKMGMLAGIVPNISSSPNAKKKKNQRSKQLVGELTISLTDALGVRLRPEYKVTLECNHENSNLILRLYDIKDRKDNTKLIMQATKAHKPVILTVEIADHQDPILMLSIVMLVLLLDRECERLGIDGTAIVV